MTILWSKCLFICTNDVCLQGAGNANSIKYKEFLLSIGDFVYVEPRYVLFLLTLLRPMVFSINFDTV